MRATRCRVLNGLWLSAVTAAASAAPATIPDDPAGVAMLREAREIIAPYHAGRARTNRTLRVVYFVPKDGAPLVNYQERLGRVMDDVSNYYRDGLHRLDIETAGLPLERKQGKLVLHVVRGKLPGGQ